MPDMAFQEFLSVIMDHSSRLLSSHRFAETYDFLHRTSSPKHPKANGQAERAVGIVKALLNKARDSGSDPYLALLAYRKAPRDLGASPSEMLMGRRLRSRIPEPY